MLFYLSVCQTFDVYFSELSCIIKKLNCTCPVNTFVSCIACDVPSLHSQIHIKHGSNFKWKSRCKVERDGQKWIDSEVSNVQHSDCAVYFVNIFYKVCSYI